MNGLASISKGSRRRGRQPGELTYKQLGCRQSRCNQMELDHKDAKTRHPPKHRRRYEIKFTPHRLIVKKEPAPLPKKEKKAEYRGGMRAGEYLGYVDSLYKFKCPYCYSVNSIMLLQLRICCDRCFSVFSI